MAEDRARPRLAVGSLAPMLRVDGVLDEPAWAAAPSIEDLVMVEPRAGERPAARTIVKVLAGPKALAFGIRCEDADAAAIVSFTKERDGDFEFEDHVILVLDPFQDGRSGYVFAVNPGGARLDALVDPGGEDVNKNWDGEWEAATTRSADGWTAEIRIPIETLGFKRGLGEWYFNVQRRVQRLQETSRWASAVPDYEVFQTSRAGVLAGLPPFDLGLGLGIRPSLVGGFDSPAPGTPIGGTFEPSLDVTQRLGSNLLASLTVNTDFAETEVDTRQTNLTRFPLFFPEKRTFFLDGTDIFQFGTGTGDELIPFFSRRIGLVAGQEVPILAGLKATGRVGDTSLGALAIRTRRAVGRAPAASMAVLRVKQNVLAESWAGLLLTVGDPLGRAGSWEAGADITFQTSRFRGNKNFSVGVWGLATGRADLADARERTAFGFKVDYPNDLLDCFALYRRVGDGFDPSLGFVPRRGINAYQAGCTYAPRPKGTFIRQMFHRLYPTLVTDLDGRWESYEIEITPVDWLLESGDNAEFSITPTGERLVAPFGIAENVVAGRGSYHWRRFRLQLESASKRKLAAEATWTFDGFYTGKLDLQFDTEDRTFGTNTRLRWTFHPRGDLFVIYNHNLREITDRWQRDANELLVKLQYTFRR